MRQKQHRSVRLLAGLLGVPIGIAIAAPAYALPGGDEAPNGDDQAFLSSLHQLGINFQDPQQAIKAGQAVCGLMVKGESGLEVLDDLEQRNPGLGPNGAAQFAMLSAKAYCPHQLQGNKHGIKDEDGG